MGALYEDVEKFFGDIFAAYGRFLARHPVVFISLSLVTSSLLGIGLLNVTYENDMEKLYTPMGSPAVKDRSRVSELFPDSTRTSYYFHQLIYPGAYGEVFFLDKQDNNILSEVLIYQISLLHNELLAITLEDDDRGLHYSDVCATRNEHCVVDGQVILNTVTENGCLNNTKQYPNLMDDTGYVVDLRRLLSGISLENHCVKAKALHLRYNLRRDTAQQQKLAFLWEKRFLQILSQYKNDKLDFAYAASSSMNLEFANHLGSDTKFFSITIVIMVAYAIFVSSGGDWVSTRTLLAQAGIFAALLSILASFGFLSMCGMVFVDICGVMPFLILGVGVDDMFVLMSGWRHTDSKQTIEARMGQTFRTSAISITITSLTNLLAFCIGATSPFLSVKNFCVYAGVAVLFCYINHLTFFAGCMVVNARRMTSARHCVTCLKTKSRKDLTDADKSGLYVACCNGQPPVKTGDDDSYCDKIPYTTLPRLLLKWPVKMMIIVLFVIYLGVAILGASQIKIGLKLETVVPDSSYLSKYFTFRQNYFLKYGAPVMFVVSQPIAYHSIGIRNDIHNMLKRAVDDGLTDDEYKISWLDKYVAYLEHNDSINFADLNREEFVSILKDTFLEKYSEYKNDVLFNREGTVIKASRFYVRAVYLNESLPEEEMMATMRSVAFNSSLPVIAFSTEFIYYEHYVSILKNTLLAVGVAIIGMLFIALMFIPHAISICCVTVTMITIVLGMFGFMHFWDLELSAITNVQIVLSVGFCVDFTVHISHAFMTATGKNRNERVVAALEKVGMPIMNGAFSSILGVLILAFANSYVYRSFFKTMLLVIVLGIAHSLLLLPVVLSFIGPRRTSKPRVFIPISVNWGGGGHTTPAPPYHPKQLGEDSLASPGPPPPSAAGSRNNLAADDMELMQLQTPVDSQGPGLVPQVASSSRYRPRTLLDTTPEEEQFKSPLRPQEVEVRLEKPPVEYLDDVTRLGYLISEYSTDTVSSDSSYGSCDSH